MSNGLFSGSRDVSCISRSATPTPPRELLFLCGCKGLRAGAQIKRIKGVGELLMRCPKCNAKEVA